MAKLTMEEMKRYKQLRESFLDLRNRLNPIIQVRMSQIKTNHEAIGKMEADIESARTRLPGCDKSRICAVCDIYSMKETGRRAIQGGMEYSYECVLCSNEASFDTS